MNSTFVKELKRLRTEHGYSQEELANRIHVSRSRIGMWEQGRREPSYEALELIADFFNVPIATFVDGKSPKDKSETIPIYGSVAAGTPIDMIDDIIGELEVGEKMQNGEYFALRIKGDSMLPRIQDGDIVIASVNRGTATCKRLKLFADGVMLSPATVRGYNEIIRNRFQGIMDQKITDINNWQIAINEESAKVAAKTVENAWLLVKPVLKNERIPVPEIRLPQVASNDQPWLTYEEIQLLLKEIKGKPVEIGALLALHGLRRSEIYALDKKSIDLSANVINVRGARVEAPEGGYVKKPQNKNRTSARVVPIMIPRLAEAIREMAPDQKMLPYSEKHLCDQINKRCRAAGITEVGTHGCRRSFASMCAHEGVPLDICAKLGGWADIVTMKKIYLKVCNNDLERYADVIRAKFA